MDLKHISIEKFKANSLSTVYNVMAFKRAVLTAKREKEIQREREREKFIMIS